MQLPEYLGLLVVLRKLGLPCSWYTPQLTYLEWIVVSYKSADFLRLASHFRLRVLRRVLKT